MWDYKNLIGMLVMSIAARVLPPSEVEVDEFRRALREKKGLTGRYRNITFMVAHREDFKLVPTLLKSHIYLRTVEELRRQGSLSDREMRALEYEYEYVQATTLKLGSELFKDTDTRFSRHYTPVLNTIPNRWRQRNRLIRAIQLLRFLYHPTMANDPNLQPLQWRIFCDIYSFTIAVGEHDPATTPNYKLLNQLDQLTSLLQLKRQEARDILEKTEFCKDPMLNWWGDQSGAKAQSQSKLKRKRSEEEEGKEDEKEKEKEKEKEDGNEKEDRIRSFLKYIIAAPKRLFKWLLRFLGLSHKDGSA